MENKAHIPIFLFLLLLFSQWKRKQAHHLGEKMGRKCWRFGKREEGANLLF